MITSPAAATAAAVTTTGRKRPLESGPDPDPPEHLDKHPRTEILSPGGEAKRKHDIGAKDGERLCRLRGVNRSVMSMLDGALDRDPGADLSNLLKSHAQVYPSRRKKAEERARRGNVCSGRWLCLPLCIHIHIHIPPKLTKISTALLVPLQRREPTPQVEATLKSFVSSSTRTSYDPANPRLSKEAKRTLQARLGVPKIIKPLAPCVLAILAKSNGDDVSTDSPEPPEPEPSESIDCWLPRQLGRAIADGVVLRHISGKVVVRLDENVVVKLGTDTELDQVAILSYILQHTDKVPLPAPLGALRIEDVSYVFMPLIEGSTLEVRWPNMTKEEKCIIRDQLETIMGELRNIPPHPDFAFGWNNHCKDVRWFTRHSGPVTNEKEFNEFLLSDPLPKTTQTYLEMMRSRLRDDHRVVLTHGNLHPKNIIVTEDLTIAALIGWETGGWYPEYWEYLKALNTFSATEPEGDDWWKYTPKSIGVYHTEWALDRQLEIIVNC